MDSVSSPNQSQDANIPWVPCRLDHYVKKFDLVGSLAILGCVLCWGAVPVMLRHLTHDIDAWTANGIRFPLSAILYWPVLWTFWRAGQLHWRAVAACLVPAGLALAGQVLWAWAPYHLPASTIGFFSRFSLVWSLLAALLLFPDERKLLSVAGFHSGLLLSVIGFVLLSVSKGEANTEVTWPGILIITAWGLFFGLYTVSVRLFLRGIHPLAGFGTVAQLVSLGTLAPMFLFGDLDQVRSLSATAWILLGASSVLGIAMGHVLMYTSVQRMGATIPSSVGTLAPFVTAFLAVVFLGESLTGMEWAAGVTMVVGALFLLGTQDRTLRQRAKTRCAQHKLEDEQSESGQ